MSFHTVVSEYLVINKTSHLPDGKLFVEMYLSSWSFPLITDFEMYSRVTHYKKKIKDYKHSSVTELRVINALRSLHWAYGEAYVSSSSELVELWKWDEPHRKWQKRKFFYICIKYVHVEFHYNTKKRTELINPLELINPTLADRTNLWLGYIRLTLYNSAAFLGMKRPKNSFKFRQ